MCSRFSVDKDKLLPPKFIHVAAGNISTVSVAAGDLMWRHIPSRIQDKYANHFQVFEADDFPDMFPTEHWALNMTQWIWNTLKRPLKCSCLFTVHWAWNYKDTLTDQDTQSDTLSAHLKLLYKPERANRHTHATLSGFLYAVSQVGSAGLVGGRWGLWWGHPAAGSQWGELIRGHNPQSNSVASMQH